ncbi:MAG: universal stress protein [Caldilineales bacterium]|nr:universal stress protein [Caldilineales bacterium]
MFEHIIVPLDGSSFGEKALIYALELAHKFDSRLTLVEVLPPEKYEWEGEMRAESPESSAKIQAKETDVTQNYLQQKEQELRKQGFEVDAIIMKGQGVAEGIVHAADETGGDIIVMTCHEIAGFQRLMLRSVAEQVLREATIPVLMIRIPD